MVRVHQAVLVVAKAAATEVEAMAEVVVEATRVSGTAGTALEVAVREVALAEGIVSVEVVTVEQGSAWELAVRPLVVMALAEEVIVLVKAVQVMVLEVKMAVAS